MRAKIIITTTIKQPISNYSRISSPNYGKIISMKQGFTLDFNNEYDRSYNNYREIFKRLNKKTFDYLQIEENYLIEVNLVDSGEIQHINKTFRGIDAPTDVI